jgi:hypothetical protein
MLRTYQEQCEKSDLWKGLTGYLAYQENDDGFILVTTANVTRTQKCKITDNSSARKGTFGGYIHDLKCDGKSNPRLDELAYFSGIPNLDDQLHWENALQIVLDLIRDQSQVTHFNQMLAVWRRIADRLIHLEDLVSYSLLKRKFEEIRLTLPLEVIREALGVENIHKDDFNPIAEMRAALQNPMLIHCLSARRFDTLCGFFPEIKAIVFADRKSFSFVTMKFNEDYLKLTNKDMGSMFKFYLPAFIHEQTLPPVESTLRVPAGLGEFGGLH